MPEVNIKQVERIQSSPKQGLRQGWTEYQVKIGRRVLSRHDTQRQADKAVEELLAKNDDLYKAR
jgi:hypothetical protein